MTISISELEKIEQAMTSGDWRPSEKEVSSGPIRAVTICAGAPGADAREIGITGFNSADMLGILAARNALPALLTIAKAALAWHAVQYTGADYRDQDAACQRLFDAVEDGIRQ